MAKKILIIEDEQPIVNLLKIRLEASGYEVIFATDGQKGLNRAREEAPDLIILDIMLPTMNGYQILRMLKFDGRYKEIPIIVLTAKGLDEDKKLGQDLGADAYFGKPFEPTDLLEKIKELL
jgi:two-component system, OmpR family, alkaline phosphatase synthesis response regulator PhoP